MVESPGAFPKRVGAILVALVLVGVAAVVVRLSFESGAGKSTTESGAQSSTALWGGALTQTNLAAADPSVMYFDDEYYAYFTSKGLNVATSVDGITYENLGPTLGTSDLPPNLGDSRWAPSVAWDGLRFVMVFAAQDEYDPNKAMCIWRATSNSPKGPFTNVTIWYCEATGYGVIDPSLFDDVSAVSDPGEYTLARFGSVGSSVGCGLYSIETNPDGSSGMTHLLLSGNCGDNTASDNYKENPEMVMAPDGTYVLFYSMNDYGTDNYATGWATCVSPRDGCIDHGRLLTTSTVVDGKTSSGPGGLSIGNNGRFQYVGFHRRDASVGAGRYLTTAALTWRNGHTPVFGTDMASPTGTGT